MSNEMIQHNFWSCDLNYSIEPKYISVETLASPTTSVAPHQSL